MQHEIEPILSVLIFVFSICLLPYSIRTLVLLKAIKSMSSDYSSCYDFSNPFKAKISFPNRNCKSDPQQNFSRAITQGANSRDFGFRPFISVLVATHNERIVLDRLMRSLESLSYARDKFEIIIVDDSNDGTYELLCSWTLAITNLKVIRRKARIGWKGGALNIALENLNEKSQYVLVADADTFFIHDTLAKFAFFLTRSISIGLMVSVVQGYPISVVFPKHRELDADYHLFHKDVNINWVARGISFRLAQRNNLEFFGKELLNLPLQITGSLFMIRTDLIKLLRFKPGLTEDWDLTLDVYLSSHSNYTSSLYTNNDDTRSVSRRKKVVAFNPNIISYCEATTKLGSYCKQRMRVSEGHTRSFRSNITSILKYKAPFTHRLELFLNGLQYAKFIGVLTLILLDSLALLVEGFDFFAKTDLVKISLLFQTISLSVDFLSKFITVGCSSSSKLERYTIWDAIYSTSLSVFTMPALVLGSLRGFCKQDGFFYRTERNT
jgi:cellulose synthase/poly-beta-1,6-N-acetylglucosamine synthase-like glycosyltransferase